MCDQPPAAIVPLQRVRLAHPLFHLQQQLAGNRDVRIVAIGSSSTEGEGVSPYPARLGDAMAAQFPGRLRVLNKGIGGEEAPLELARMERDVIAETPAMVIWQVGTNAAFKIYDLDDMAAAIDRGLRLLSAQPLDVMLMDLQYVPALLRSDTLAAAAERMVALIADIAEKAGVNVFRRFALMRHWHEVDGVPMSQLVSPTDDLHQGEWSTAGVAQALKFAIDDGITRAQLAVNREPGRRV